MVVSVVSVVSVLSVVNLQIPNDIRL